MNIKLQIFNNSQFGQVRWIEVDNKPYAVGIDVARALGYKKPSQAIIDHCKGIRKMGIPSSGGIQETNLITQGDVFRLAAKSELPGAQEFEAWIFDEVLPQIRQTGGYIPNNENDTDEDLLAKALLIAHKTIEKKDKLLEAQKPKVVFADAVSASNSSILVGEMAKILKQNGIDTGEKRFFTWLRDNGYLIKREGTDYNMPTQKSMDLKLFEIKETPIIHSDGYITVGKTPKVNGKGQIYFINKFKEEKDEC